MGMVNPDFWKGKRVLITGMTGFKGSWLTVWLHSMGAKCIGYSLRPPSNPSMFEACHINYKDPDTFNLGWPIEDKYRVSATVEEFKPQIVFHLAAQPLVLDGYKDPVYTFSTNVIGTINVLEALRNQPTVKSVVIVTSDKVYENDLNGYSNSAFTEQNTLGGFDPYSASKACAELVVKSYRKSFFKDSSTNIATVRAGNVIGGGDWAKDRIIPDAVRSIRDNDTLIVRSPRAIRPWQHVIDPLTGYIMLAEKLYTHAGYDKAWNFGPVAETDVSVSELLNKLFKIWGNGAWLPASDPSIYIESKDLRLDSSLAYKQLHWYQRISFDSGMAMTVEWYKNYYSGADMYEFTCKQLDKIGALD